MKVLSVTGSIPTKRVVIAEIDETTPDSEVVDLALAATGETRSSLFGTRTERHGSVATVHLYTD